MGKKQKIKELENRIKELEVRIAQLETQPVWYSQYPKVPQVPQVPQKPTDWWWHPTDYSRTAITNNVKTTDQHWFWTPEWQAEELAVESELATGQFEEFDNMDDFLATLE